MAQPEPPIDKKSREKLKEKTNRLKKTKKMKQKGSKRGEGVRKRADVVPKPRKLALRVPKKKPEKVVALKRQPETPSVEMSPSRIQKNWSHMWIRFPNAIESSEEIWLRRWVRRVLNSDRARAEEGSPGHPSSSPRTRPQKEIFRLQI